MGLVRLLNYSSTYSYCFLLQAQSARSFLHTCASPQTPTDGEAWIISLTPMQQLGIKLTSAQLHFFEGP